MRQSRTPLLRTARSVAMIALLVSVAACGGGSSGGGGGGGGGTTASFAGSGTQSGQGFVRLGNPNVLAGGLIEIDVILEGQILNGDVFGFAFDVIMDMSTIDIVRFVSVTGGNALSTGPLQVQGQQGLNGTEVAAIIGVTLTGTDVDNDIPAGDNIVCTLTFQVMAKGDTLLTFAGGPVPGGGMLLDAAALDSGLGIVAAITFDTAEATITGS